MALELASDRLFTSDRPGQPGTAFARRTDVLRLLARHRAVRDKAGRGDAALGSRDLIDRLNRRRAPELLPSLERSDRRIADRDYAPAVAFNALEVGEREGDAGVDERQRLDGALDMLDSRCRRRCRLPANRPLTVLSVLDLSIRAPCRRDRALARQCRAETSAAESRCRRRCACRPGAPRSASQRPPRAGS